MNPQLHLGITLRDDATLENFVAGENRQLLAELIGLASESGAAPLYLWGPRGCGKSHLLQAACHAASERGRPCVYLPLGEAGIVPEIVEGLEQLELVCIDDLGRVAGDSAWEEALFHLYNRLMTRGGVWVAAADRSPGVLPIRLADLSSRLAWGTSYRVKGLSDEARIALLVDRAASRGLDVSAETATYLVRRAPQETGALLDLFGRLDEASMVAKRRITIPFVKAVLGWE